MSFILPPRASDRTPRNRGRGDDVWPLVAAKMRIKIRRKKSEHDDKRVMKRKKREHGENPTHLGVLVVVDKLS